MRIKLYQCGGEKPISEYPLGLGYLKTNWDADVEIVKEKDDLIDCDLIGLSSNAWGLWEAVKIMEASDVPVIIGGQGTLWKGLRQYDFKHIVIGEGELALNWLMSGMTEKTIRMINIEHIDDIKFPDRGECGREVPILTSRGCPFKCRFCTSDFWGELRFHSAEYFMEEIREILVRYPKARTLRIMDDVFIVNKKRFYEIFKLWMEGGFYKKFTLHTFVRADVLTEENIRMMKYMGFSMRFGAESGSDRMLKNLNKGTTVAMNQKAIDMANKVGIPVSASFMYGLPGETKEDYQQTRNFIDRNKGKMQVSGWYKFKAFPGSVLYDGKSPLEEDMRVR